MNISTPVALSKTAAPSAERSRREDTPAEPGAFAELLAQTLAPTIEAAPAARDERQQDKPDEDTAIDPAALALLFVPVEARATPAAGMQAAGTLPAGEPLQALKSGPLEVSPAGPEVAEGLAETGDPARAATEDVAPLELASIPTTKAVGIQSVAGKASVDEAPAPAPAAAPQVADATPAAFTSQQQQGGSDQGGEGDKASAPLQPTPGLETLAARPAAATHVVQASPSPEPAIARGQVEPPVGSREWAPALGQEMVKLHQAALGRAELQLHPAGLGPLHVVITVADQQAQAQFISAHPAVRAAVEAALPQLRASLAESGISLGQTAVGGEQQSSSSGFMSRESGRGRQYRMEVEDLVSERTVIVRGGHSVDTFA